MRPGKGGMGLLAACIGTLMLGTPAMAVETAAPIDLTQHPVGYTALVIFFLAYGFVAVEKAIQLRKSKPVMLAAGLIWGLLGFVYAFEGRSAELEAAMTPTS